MYCFQCSSASLEWGNSAECRRRAGRLIKVLKANDLSPEKKQTRKKVLEEEGGGRLGVPEICP